MAKQASVISSSKALNFLYKIRTDEFVKSPSFAFVTANIQEWQYSVDLAVDKHPEYPEIPPSTWTLTLTVKTADGTVRSDLEPKGGPTSVTSPRLIAVDCRARMMMTDWEHKPFLYNVGPEGFEQSDGADLSEMLVRNVAGGSSVGLVNDPHMYVSVSVTFMVEKTATRRGVGTLYEINSLVDCQLVCGERDFSVHRAILATQSPVFAAMFQKQMPPEICTIKDVSPDVLDALLQYAYTGEMTKAEGKLQEIWSAAHKYEMPELKQECERLMLGSVTEENSAEILYFASNRGLKRLKVEVAKKIVSHESE